MLRPFQHGSASMTQVYMPNNSRRRREVMVPQRQYVPHHRQNYFDHFAPESDITFPSRTGPDGIPLADVLNDNFDNLVGRDDPMFAGYVGPAISLRLEVSSTPAYLEERTIVDLARFLVAGL
jgi:hypothetical protein